MLQIEAYKYHEQHEFVVHFELMLTFPFSIKYDREMMFEEMRN